MERQVRTSDGDGAAVERLAALLTAAAGAAVVLTGAGVSVPSGIPDFRTPETGLWADVDPMEVAHIDVFERDPARFWSYYRPRFQQLDDKQPNAAHAAIAELERRGLVRGAHLPRTSTAYTAPRARQLEVHGSIATSSCRDCGASFYVEEVEELFDDDGIPHCASCHGPLKPDVVLFGELLPEAAIERAAELAEEAALMICVGSSLIVHPVAGLPALTREHGGRLAIVTKGETPYDEEAEVRLSGEVDAELTALVAALA